MKQSVHSSGLPEASSEASPQKAIRTHEAVSSRPSLTDAQKQVLDCLGQSGAALTYRQLATAVSCPEQELQEAVDSLVDSNLISRLNTVIPSFSPKYTGVRIYDE